ncbi:soluble NSF attachment protein [Sporodiniella umbellata]|nr:soluble NSF attachment protein [Sporodiniella umbellata]
MSEHLANDLLLQAEKKLNSWTWFSKTNKHEDAAEIYEKAGNTFKLAQRWKEAGDAYLKAAELYRTTPEFHFECSKAFENASKCLKRMDAQAAIDVLKLAISVDKDACNFRNAAKHHQEIAEIYETEIIDLRGARENWEEASKLYMADDTRPMINKCVLKVAHFDAQLEEYNLAIEHFEQVATDSIDNSLTKWSNKEYYLKAGMCSLCTSDTVKTHELLSRYSAIDASFENTREFQFLSGILECVENNDTELFTQKVREFDSLTKLDNWKINILLKVRKAMDSNK